MSLRRHLELGSRWTFVGGKGGVGKTTVAAALAIELADAAEQVTVLSTDPAHSLGDALGIELGPEPSTLPPLPRLQALEIGAEHERDRFLNSHRPAIAALLERGTYLDTADIEEVTGLAIPGMDELAALLRLLDMTEPEFGRIIVDTAPTGHTLRLLELPTRALSWIDAMDAMEAKHEAVASAFTRSYRPDHAAEFLHKLRDDLVRAADLLRDKAATRFILVTTPEPGVVAESRRLVTGLEALGISLGGIVVNRHSGAPSDTEQGDRIVYVPRLSEPIDGIEGLRRYAATTVEAPAEAGEQVKQSGGAGIILGGPFDPPADRKLYLVGGKGGVGKSTTAAALAIALTEKGRGPILLLSVDPAGSLSDVLAQPVARERAPSEEVPGLWIQQLDADTAWNEFRREYQEEVNDLFEGMLGGSLSATHDRDVMQRLVDLAPPGLDELMALVEVIDTTEDALYDALVLDTAPTGHLLRLLEMPGVALQWAHTMLRLLLKYRQVTGLGGLAERVLKLTRSLRGLQERLADPQETCFIAVALPETLSIPETERLFSNLQRLGVSPGPLLVNRALSGGGVDPSAERLLPRLARAANRGGTGAAPILEQGPAGAADLKKFWAGSRAIALSDSTEPVATV